mmetsp:Transcript_5754/g.13383  ORF Transcript_5754/g.13383 Transcript_5754/m.13383 type:complete len:359 (-) Transcript_5754:229-1305(-)
MMVPSKLAVYAATIAFLKDCRGFTTPTSNNNNNIPRYQSFGISNVNADTNHRISLLRVFDNGRAPASKTTIRNHRFAPTRSTTTQRRMGAVDNDEVAFLSDDPFVILGLDAPTADKKILKRAYKKRALKYHPDVVTDIHSNPEDKKKASDRFAKINGAYEQLMGKGGKGSKSTSTSDSNSNSKQKDTNTNYRDSHSRATAATDTATEEKPPTTATKESEPLSASSPVAVPSEQLELDKKGNGDNTNAKGPSATSGPITNTHHSSNHETKAIGEEENESPSVDKGTDQPRTAPRKEGVPGAPVPLSTRLWWIPVLAAVALPLVWLAVTRTDTNDANANANAGSSSHERTQRLPTGGGRT